LFQDRGALWFHGHHFAQPCQQRFADRRVEEAALALVKRQALVMGLSDGFAVIGIALAVAARSFSSHAKDLPDQVRPARTDWPCAIRFEKD
jgi:hypothetical protein